MNNKDYVNISKIINSELRQSEISEEARPIMAIANKLSDYFERESNEIAKDKYNPDNINEFNRRQFLKDCGVE